MTHEPISDEIAVLAAVITAGMPKAISRLDAAQFERRADSLIRGFISSLKSKLSPPIPPDVQAAMERYRRHKMACSDDRRAESPYWLEHGGIWHMERLKQDAFDIATWAVSHFGKDET